MSDTARAVREVVECITHHYADARGRWWWHCFVCDDGSNKRGRHHRGHKLESDAAYGAKQHAAQQRRNRRARARSAEWHERIRAATDPAEFGRIWQERYPAYGFNPDHTLRETMLKVQAYLRHPVSH